MPDSDPTLFTVTDLKQYTYCQRILYYHTCLPDIRPTTRKMQMGIRRHEDEHKRSMRRTMRLDGIDHAQREFDVTVQSDVLGLSGQIDEVILFADSLVPVDYKLAKKAGKHFKLQVAAYAMMAEEHFNLPALRGMIYLIRSQKTEEVTITRRLRKQIQQTVEAMREIAETEYIPEATPFRRQCVDCEFRRFCNDV